MQSEKQKKWKQQDYKERKVYFQRRDKRRREKFKAIIQAAKNKPCKRCGNSFHYSAMEFHHLEDKKFELSDIRVISSENKLHKEIRKCDVVCSNCHQIIEWMKRTGELSPDSL